MDRPARTALGPHAPLPRAAGRGPRPRSAPTAAGGAAQPTLTDLGTPLIATTFVVLDLETTGLSPERDRITELGAVKVRGGEVVGELATLVHPGRAVPSAVTAVTGITDGMLRGAPPIGAVLPSLLEFLGDAVLVAHNARFDVGFLRAALARHDGPRLEPPVVDTARLARRLLREEVRDVRLATLAAHLRARTRPEHRALADARATVDVLHGLIERAGSYGATTLEDLRDLSHVRSTRAYAKVDLVRDAPRTRGTYRFLGDDGEVLYVGKATDLHDRLRTYFGHDRRRRIDDLVRATARVTWTTTATLLEAEVDELRAIRAHQPRFNRRSKAPRGVHVALTREPFPRLSIVGRPRAQHLRTVGPLSSRRVAEHFVEAAQEACGLRPCTPRLRRAQDHAACALKELGRCAAPCDGTQTAEGYAAAVARFEAACDDPTGLLATLRARMVAAAAERRYERARTERVRRHVVARVLAERRAAAAIEAVPEVVLARPVGDEVEVVVLRHGRLAGATRHPGEPAPARVLDAVAPPALADRPDPGGDDHPEERRLVRRWCAQSGVWVLRCQGTWTEPVAGGRALAEVVAEAGRVERQVRRDRQDLTRSKVVRRAPADDGPALEEARPASEGRAATG